MKEVLRKVFGHKDQENNVERILTSYARYDRFYLEMEKVNIITRNGPQICMELSIIEAMALKRQLEEFIVQNI